MARCTGGDCDAWLIRYRCAWFCRMQTKGTLLVGSQTPLHIFPPCTCTHFSVHHSARDGHGRAASGVDYGHDADDAERADGLLFKSLCARDMAMQQPETGGLEPRTLPVWARGWRGAFLHSTYLSMGGAFLQAKGCSRAAIGGKDQRSASMSSLSG